MPHSQGENRDKNPEKTAVAEKSKQALSGPGSCGVDKEIF
jgi:hypothetical protein